MSNSTSDSTLGECVVCGTRTPTRCSECASNGTKWMYFCSREHQKLIYKTHKRVCGKLGSPSFMWPTFNEKESERYMHLGYLRTPYLGVGHETFDEAVMSKVIWPLQCNYGTLVQLLKRPYDGVFDEARFIGLAVLRLLAHSVRWVKQGSDGVPYHNLEEKWMFELIGEEIDAYELMLSEFATAWPSLSIVYRKSEWWSPLMHRSIIFYDLKAKAQNSKGGGENSTELLGYLIHTTRELLKLLRGVVAKSHPQEAEKFAKQLEEAFGSDGLEAFVELTRGIQ
ncbi:hypothetical protein JCM5353_004059 [Sporobolomyces roseus]